MNEVFLPASWKPARYLEVRAFLDLLCFLLRGSFKFIFLLIALESPQLLLDAASLFPHLLPMLLIKQRKLPSAAERGDAKPPRKMSHSQSSDRHPLKFLFFKNHAHIQTHIKSSSFVVRIRRYASMTAGLRTVSQRTYSLPSSSRKVRYIFSRLPVAEELRLVTEEASSSLWEPVETALAAEQMQRKPIAPKRSMRIYHNNTSLATYRTGQLILF